MDISNTDSKRTASGLLLKVKDDKIKILEEENKQLKDENEKLKEQIEILKKASDSWVNDWDP